MKKESRIGMVTHETLVLGLWMASGRFEIYLLAFCVG
jgi:hypothetical protein